MRLLRTSDQFRVRAQAALALARPNPEAGVVDALISALADGEPAVRAAAAAALETAGDPRALDALRTARQDSDRDVRAAIERAIHSIEHNSHATPVAATAVGPDTGGRGRFYVSVGTPGAQVVVEPAMLESTRRYIESTVQQIAGVELAPQHETDAAARTVLAQRQLAGFYLENRVTSVDMQAGGSLRVQVSVTVTTYPGRDIRSMLSGAATIPGAGPGPDVRQQAIEGAFRAALRNLPQALAAGAASQGLPAARR